MHIGQAKVAAGITKCQTLVIESHQVQNSGMQIVEVNFILHSIVSIVIRLAIGQASTHASACHPDTKPMWIVVTAIGIFGSWSAAKFSAPDHKGFIQHTALFEIGE